MSKTKKLSEEAGLRQDVLSVLFSQGGQQHLNATTEKVQQCGKLMMSERGWW